MPHHCHALRCRQEVKPELLMCFPHWRRVPRAIQRMVWQYYRQGQCDDRQPSAAWMNAADLAINAVAVKEYGAQAKCFCKAMDFCHPRQRLVLGGIRHTVTDCNPVQAAGIIAT
jgi:hypothetical protein